MRDWCAILIDAGLRDIGVRELARELQVSPECVSRQTKRYAIRLNGQWPTCTKTKPRARTLRPKDWKAEFALALVTHETLSRFCHRVGVCPSAAQRAARTHGHTFPSMTTRKLTWWRRELALAEAGQETLNTFCRRTGKSAGSATQWAQYLGHTFPASKRTLSGRQGRATRLANAQAQA